MTLMLASVATPGEAEAVSAGGADIIDLKNPSQGALGALDPSVAAEIVRAIAGRRHVSATAGAAHPSPDVAVAAVASMSQTGVDYVKVGLSSDQAGAECIRALGALTDKIQLVGILFADRKPDLGLLPLMAEQGFRGAMLDTAAKGSGRLLDHMGVAALDRFVGQCRDVGLKSGLAGSLEAPDVPRLLPLRPDYLGFRGALCHGRVRDGDIDVASVRLIRDLIPRVLDRGIASSEVRIESRLASRAPFAAGERGIETDRVFVHDLIRPCAIGAYDFERGILQDVRFNVDVDVRRGNNRSDDMRDIFSYDLIIDSINILLGRGHIDLIETLARDLADKLLHHSAVVRVCVRVEKLDVINGHGTVGVEIKRERASENPAIDLLFPNLPDVAGSAGNH
jgi:FolB domain-containing protein